MLIQQAPNLISICKNLTNLVPPPSQYSMPPPNLGTSQSAPPQSGPTPTSSIPSLMSVQTSLPPVSRTSFFLFIYLSIFQILKMGVFFCKFIRQNWWKISNFSNLQKVPSSVAQAVPPSSGTGPSTGPNSMIPDFSRPPPGLVEIS